MTAFADVVKAFEKGRRQYEELISKGDAVQFVQQEMYNCSDKTVNTAAQGDNLAYMLHLLKNRNMAGKIQLIYVDPPFFSNEKYQASVKLESEVLGKSPLIKLNAYDDCWASGLAEYLEMLTVRFFLMRDLLTDTGCIWVHLDWHVTHYARMILDQVFGYDNFVNEIIWTYKSGGANKRSFAKKHDNLLVYSKTDKYKFNVLKEKSYNRQFKPYRFKGVEEFEDEIGWYTMVNMKDVWQIDMVGRTSAERTGYATQKPEKLIERIILSCTDEGDICADFFAGSGTLGAVCEKNGRKWIMCDAGKLALSCQIERMGIAGSSFAVERVQDSDEVLPIYFKIHDAELYLESYEAEIPDETDKFSSELEHYLKNDSLSLIKCWSADFAYDGTLHRSLGIIKGTQRNCQADKNMHNMKVSVVGYDVFGRRFFGII